MYQDYKDVLSAFQSHGVEYLVVGGFAVIYHSQPRFTKDLDLFIKAAPANARAIYAALSDFGAPIQGIHPDDSTDRSNFFRLGREPKGFDILDWRAAIIPRGEIAGPPRPASRFSRTRHSGIQRGDCFG